MDLPALFISEIGISGARLTRTGYIALAYPTEDVIHLEYYFDEDIPSIRNGCLTRLCK